VLFSDILFEWTVKFNIFGDCYEMGTDNQLCDIGPIPWGDGIVDVQDLIVSAEHLFEEVPPVE